MGLISLKDIIKQGLARKARDEGYPCRSSNWTDYCMKFGVLEVKQKTYL